MADLSYGNSFQELQRQKKKRTLNDTLRNRMLTKVQQESFQEIIIKL